MNLQYNYTETNCSDLFKKNFILIFLNYFEKEKIKFKIKEITKA